MLLILISVAVGLAGIGLAYLMYIKRKPDPVAMAQRFRPIYVVLYNRYWVDEL